MFQRQSNALWRSFRELPLNNGFAVSGILSWLLGADQDRMPLTIMSSKLCIQA